MNFIFEIKPSILYNHINDIINSGDEDKKKMKHWKHAIFTHKTQENIPFDFDAELIGEKDDVNIVTVGGGMVNFNNLLFSLSDEGGPAGITRTFVFSKDDKWYILINAARIITSQFGAAPPLNLQRVFRHIHFLIPKEEAIKLAEIPLLNIKSGDKNET